MSYLPILVVIVLGLFAIALYAHRLGQENKRLKRDNDYYSKTYLRKQGATSLWEGSKGEMLNYDLRSFDGGVSWYAVQEQGELGQYLKVLGDVDVVYPGLMKSLSAWDAITDHVTKNGPLKLDNAADIGMLIKAGFQVKTN